MGLWWLPWTSNPVRGVNSVSGGFDSHALPPFFICKKDKTRMERVPAMTKKRVFSGIQPTGTIHLGNYIGALRQWVDMTDEYECIFCVVDYHAMTIEYDVASFKDNILDAATTLVACGLTPDKCRLFVQSRVPEHTELTWFFNCINPLGDLERMTQFKDKSQQHRENINVGLLDYPVLQAADILIYKAELVPVGEDQVQHVEFTRRIARRFNNRFGQTFPEPDEYLSHTPKILGLDGKSKMSKSMNNFIGILEPPDEIWEKLRTSVTDENRKRRKDPGNPEICNLFTMHTAFSPQELIAEMDKECRSAGIGCVDCKKKLFEHMMLHLEPIQQKAAELKRNPEQVMETLDNGARECRQIAQDVMREVRRKAGMIPEG